MSPVKAILAGTCGILLLTSCGGTTKATTVANARPVATVTQSASPTAPNSESSLASTDATKSYVDAYASQDDPDAMREGLKLTKPGSVAYAYLDHQANASEARLDEGQPDTKMEVTRDGPDELKACNDPDDEETCVTFRDFKVDPAGRLVEYTLNKQQIGTRLTAGNGQAVTAGGAKFTFLTAYKSLANALFVTVKVETGVKPLSAYISTATYRGPDGKQRTATYSAGSTDIDAKSNTIVYMAFASVKAGGKVTLDGCVGKNCGGGSFTAVMKVS